MKSLNGLIAVAALIFSVGCSQTDAGISTAVKTRLASNDLVKASEIDVDTRNTVVTLTGDVSTPAAKEEAVRIARSTEGVSDVIDRLTLDATPTATTGVADDDVRVRRTEELADEAARSTIVVDEDVEKNADAAADGVKKGADNAADGVKHGAEAAADGVKKGAEATKDGAEKVGNAAVSGTRKVVGKVKEAVTDSDRDSNRDGR